MDTKETIRKMSLILLIILIILVVFYFLTSLIQNKKVNKEIENNEESNVTIDYETILVQNIFKQGSSYYVYAKMSSDKNIATYNEDVDSYKQTENALKVYTIDLDSAFNKEYVSDISDFTKDLPVFKCTTILKIDNGKISEVYELDDINKAFD